MDYSISPDQLDKLLKPFFDKEFKHAEWGEYNDQYGGGKWYGIVNQDGVLLVGHPSHDNVILFTNGNHFTNMWDFFSVDYKDFNEAIGRYVKKKYNVSYDRIL